MLSLNAQEKRSKRARLSVESRAAKNAEAAQRMQVHRGQLTVKKRESMQMLKPRNTRSRIGVSARMIVGR